MLALGRRICPSRLRTLRRSHKSWSKRIGLALADAGAEGPFSIRLLAPVRPLAIRSTTLPPEPRMAAIHEEGPTPSQVRTKASRRTAWCGIASSLTRRGIAFSGRKEIKMSSTTKDLGIIVGVDG